jgi:hypothetical protein
MRRTTEEHFASHWLTIQPSLFDFLEDEVGELDDNQRLFVRIAESVELGRIARRYGWCGNGRKPSSRLAMFKMFVMKHVWNFPTTKDALAEVRRCPSMRRLCGWESQSSIPSESTISRAFGDFAADEIASSLFKDFVKKVAKGRIVVHRSIDSTEIDAREGAATKDEKAAAAELAAIRAQVDANAEDYNALALQKERDLDTNLALLPTLCDWGCKRNSKGKTQYWRGYKLHIAVADGDFPIAACLTSASVHDSKAAIPLMQMADEVTVSLYDLEDAAYDAKEIREFSESNNHVPIIDANPRRGAPKTDGRGERAAGVVPAEKIRFRNRSGVERVNGHLHDAHGGRTVRVRGHAKVLLHLMLGLLVIAVEQSAQMLS